MLDYNSNKPRIRNRIPLQSHSGNLLIISFFFKLMKGFDVLAYLLGLIVYSIEFINTLREDLHLVVA